MKGSLESANDIPNILIKFLLPFCSCNKTWITDILNVKKTLHKVLPSTTLCATPPTLQILIPRHHYFSFVTRVFPAGNGDKTYGHVNDVYLKTAAYTGVRYSISDVISDQSALSCGILRHKSHKIMTLQFIIHGYIRLDQNINNLVLTHASKN